LKQVDFSEVELTESIFNSCDLMGAIFEKTNLVKVDLRKALHYSIDPENNKLKKAKFSYPGVIGLLEKYEIIIE
jgi:uncharacterized protein YjbI with pentapeptide repeats